MDDQGFLVNGNSIYKLTTSFEKIGEVVLRWGVSNAVTYNVINTKAILFSKGWKSRYIAEIYPKILTLGRYNIKFNNKTTR